MKIRSVMLLSALCVLVWLSWGLINLPDLVLAQRLPNRELPVKLAEDYPESLPELLISILERSRQILPTTVFT